MDTLVGFMGWAIFGNAWQGVRTGCRRILQIGALLLACLVAHYIGAVCYPVVSIIVACLMAVIWVCRRVLRLVGTLIFHMHRLAGGAPEASDVEFHGPGTGVVPETSTLRSFKRTGDAVKQVVVRRGDEVAVFSVGNDVQNIRTHGLFLPVEADTIRGSPGLVRRIAAVDRIHLCRNVVCGEEVGEHFTEYGVVRKFNPEKFQVAHSHQGAVEATKGLWRWIAPRGKQTVSEVVTRIREYASESETEEQLCNASRVTWKTADGVQVLAESRCTAAGTAFHQVLVEDNLEGGVFLCPKHATSYLTKRYPSKCGNVECNRVGTQLRFGVRMCKSHQSERAEPEEDGPQKRSRSRSRARASKGESSRDFDQEADDEDDEENGSSKARTLLEEAAEAADGRRQKKRAASRSPGHTPKSSIQRSLARIEMLSSPGSEAETKLLEAFMEWFAQGKADGVKEEQVRKRLARERLMTDQEVVRRLIEEAEVEQANGQRGLTRFLSKWRKELKDGSTPSEKHDSEWSLLTSPQAAAEVRSTMPPIPQSFQPDPPGSQPSAGVSPTGVKEKATTPIPKPVSEVRSQEIKILPPGLYHLDRKAGAGEHGEKNG